MSHMIGYCGLPCHECPAYLATKHEDKEKLAQIAKLWSELYGTAMKPEEFICDGCLSEGGHHFSHCELCKIRACAFEKHVKACDSCEAYPCEKVGFIFQSIPETRGAPENVKGPAEEIPAWTTGP